MRKTPMIIEAAAPAVEFAGSRLTGTPVASTVRRAADMRGFFRDDGALQRVAPETPIYRVDSHTPVPAGTTGGLFFGVTHMWPGTVGDEYYMTKGHFHAVRNRGEYYWGIAGRGVLVLMDGVGTTRAEAVYPGSLHYIPGETAHRLVNVGDSALDVGACWPADAGHDYGSIAEAGFGVRVVHGKEGAELVRA